MTSDRCTGVGNT